MSFQPPTPDVVEASIPGWQSITLVDRGGFKAVYRGITNGQVEALKLILLPLSATSGDDPSRRELVGRIKRELETLRKCSVPELVRLGSLGLEESQIAGQLFLVYSEEFLDGENLWDLLKKPGPVPAEMELRILFRSLLKAIQDLWKNGYVHRDIKPKNIMKLNNPSRPFVLLDLGIAYSINDTSLTVNAQSIPATLRYIAPEMLTTNFRQNLDYRTDLYTAAISVYEYGAKRHPLARDEDDAMQTVSRALHEPPKPLKNVRPDLSDEFCSLIDQMLKKKPALRPANIGKLIKEMEARQE